MLEKDNLLKIGLSEKNKTFILVIIFALLIFLGPIEPYGMIIRISYLIIIPAIIWTIFWYYGDKWNIDITTNDKITSTLCGVLVGIFLINAYVSYTANYHTECTKIVQTRDGQECVGDYIRVKGSDKSGAILSLIFAGISFYFAVQKKSSNKL